MGSECMSLLPGVCEVLAGSRGSLPDDTSLEKLLDWFTGLTQCGGSLLEACPCLLDFISAVVSNTSSDPGVISFTLKLTGLIAANENGFKMLQEYSVLASVFSIQHWQEAGLWEDPCLRIGWIQGLKNLLQHPNALSFFVKSDFIKPLLLLHTDPSIFVATAVNQMLAHILLFQRDSSAGCNSLDKKEDKKAQTSTHSDIITVISEHLKDSLLPKENTELHQSLQTLKLLALLLSQCRFPLRYKLLQTVSESLEELVTAGYSQLTLPLMDVILASYSSDIDERVPDHRVSHLLSTMLSTNNPSDLIQAAAALVHRGFHDTVLTARAVRILLLPLEMITGCTLLDSDVTDEQHFSMSQNLKNKTSCIFTTCVCLINLPQTTLMQSDFLPCRPDLIVPSVLSLLKICSGIYSSAGCSEVYKNIIGSVRVQKCALETLAALSSSKGVKELVSEVFTVLIQYLDHPGSDPTVLQKTYQALVKWTSVCTDLSLITDQLRQDLDMVVRKRVCDIRWEVRDSTMEFLGHLAVMRFSLNSTKELCITSEVLLGGCSPTPLIREALQDTESYVRASAISTLASTLAHDWQQGAALSQEETEIVNRLLEILSDDTEGFSRRAVIRYFISWFSSHPSHSSSTSLLMECVRTVLYQGSADLDWEVKMYTLELAKLLLNEAISGQQGYSNSDHALSDPYGVISEQVCKPYTHTSPPTEGVESVMAGVLNSLVEKGVICALLRGLVDCDRPVGLKACRLLIILRDTVCHLSGSLDAARVYCKLPAGGWGEEIRKIVVKKKSHREEDLQDESVAVGVCEVLRCLDLDERLDILTESSDYIQNSPLSLLQDILTAHAALTGPDRQPGQEVIVDCY